MSIGYVEGRAFSAVFAVELLAEGEEDGAFLEEIVEAAPELSSKQVQNALQRLRKKGYVTTRFGRWFVTDMDDKPLFIVGTCPHCKRDLLSGEEAS